jgi:2-polyprenyl-3-methyl-5-hydroxy-6-metoxy-1,4-benzoquinol methylase
MEYWQAWNKFIEAYQDQKTVEIPTILSFFSFEGAKVLDYGSGSGRLSIELAPLTSEMYAVDSKKNEHVL